MTAKGLVYFIQQDVTLAVKIGFTTDLLSLSVRLSTLQTASPYRLTVVACVEGNVPIEQELHQRFSHDRLMGEWFRPSVELAECIGVLKSGTARIRELESRPAR